jgi:hypothetical protein
MLQGVGCTCTFLASDLPHARASRLTTVNDSRNVRVLHLSTRSTDAQPKVCLYVVQVVALHSETLKIGENHSIQLCFQFNVKVVSCPSDRISALQNDQTKSRHLIWILKAEATHWHLAKRTMLADSHGRSCHVQQQWQPHCTSFAIHLFLPSISPSGCVSHSSGNYELVGLAAIIMIA